MKRDFTREKLEECSFEEVVAFAKKHYERKCGSPRADRRSDRS